MPKSFKLPEWKRGLLGEARVLLRALMGALLAANLAALVMLVKPFGGSAEDLRRQQQALRQQLFQLQARVVGGKRLADKVETARRDGDQFLGRYVADRRTAMSTIVEELNRTAKAAGIKQRDVSFELQPIEGSDTLSQMTVSAGYEGNYANLTKFVNLLDKSPEFLIIESMVASPQQSGQLLNVSFRLDMFVREEAGPEL
jgi:Tfp pilus assembly protein PilO